MAKSKPAQPDKALKSSKDAQVKSLSSVKQGAVTKPSQTSKSKSKDIAKQVAMKADKVGKEGKVSKKAKKEPTPELSSSGDDDEEEDDSGDEESGADGSESEEESEDESSAVSDSSDESEAEVPAHKAVANTNGIKTNGVARNAFNKESEDEDSGSSESSDSSDDEEEDDNAAKSAPVTVAGALEESESEDSGEDDEEESDGDTEGKGGVDAKALNGKLKEVASKEASSDEESDSEEASSGGSEGSSEGSSEDESEDEEEEATIPAPKKRKAEAEAAPAAKKTRTESKGDEATERNLFVGHLSYNVDEEWLTREFESFGELSAVRVITDRETGRSKGFGYIEFVNSADGVKAQKAMHETEIDGRAINVDFSKPKPAAEDRTKSFGDNLSPASETLFVANLSFEATEDTVGEEFAKHGEVLSVRLPTDRDTGRMKGFAYVQFSSVEEAQKGFDNMKGALILGRPIRLDFSTPRPARNEDFFGGRGGRGGGFRGGRGGNDRGGRGGRGRGGFNDRGGRGGGRGGRGGSTNRGGFSDFQGKKMSLS